MAKLKEAIVSFGERFKVPVSISANSSGVSVNIGSFIPVRNISAPAGTLSVKLIIAVAADWPPEYLPAGKLNPLKFHLMRWKYRPGSCISLLLPMKGILWFSAATLLYIGSKNNQLCIIEKKGFNPAGIINAAYC